MQLAGKVEPDRSETLDGDLGALEPVITLQLVFHGRFDPSQNTIGCVGGGVSAGLAGAGDVLGHFCHFVHVRHGHAHILCRDVETVQAFDKSAHGLHQFRGFF